MRRRIFTLNEANEYLSWLEERFKAMEPLTQAIRDLQKTQEELKRLGRSNGHSGVEDKMARLRQEEEKVKESIHKGVEEINKEGIIVRNVEMGLVDFLTLQDGHEVYLCWMRDDGPVGYWHKTDEGYTARRPL